MANYTVDDVKKLRAETDAGMMDCKAALDEAEGDYQKAVAIVKAKGLAKADKKSAERTTGEGAFASYVHSTGKIATLVELLCETDFVARNDEFLALAKDIAMQVAALDPKDNAELLAQDSIKHEGNTIETLIKELSGKTGEKIELGRFVRMMVGDEA